MGVVAGEKTLPSSGSRAVRFRDATRIPSPGCLVRLPSVVVALLLACPLPFAPESLAFAARPKEPKKITRVAPALFDALVTAAREAPSTAAPGSSPSASSGVDTQEVASPIDEGFTDAFHQCTKELFTGTSDVSLAEWAIGLLKSRFRMPHDDATDVVFSVLIDICEAHSTRPYVDLQASYVRAVRNRATDVWRRHNRELLCVDVAAVADGCGSSLDAFDEVRLRGETEAAHREFCRLRPLERTVLALRAMDLSYAEIGTSLRTTEVRARSTYHNAVRRVQANLKDRCPVDRASVRKAAPTPPQPSVRSPVPSLRQSEDASEEDAAIPDEDQPDEDDD